MSRRKSQAQTFGRRLKWQLLAVFVVTITLLMGVVSLSGYRQSELVIQEQSSKLMQQQFQQSEYHITSYTNEIGKVMRLLMIQEDMLNYMRSGWQSEFRNVEQLWKIFDYANMMMQNYDYIESIYYYGDDGTAVGLTGHRQMVSHEKDLSLPWYQLKIQEQTANRLGEFLWFGGYTNRDFSIVELAEEEETIPCLTAVCSVWLTASRYVTVIINIRQDSIAGILAVPDDSSSEQESYLIDEQGTIVVHRDSEKIGAKADFAPEELADAPEDYLMRDNIQINYYRMEGPGWTIVTEIPEAELYGKLVSLKWWFIWLTVGGLLLALTLYAYSISRLTAPLTQLRIAMERMENGTLGEQLDESSQNELGMLGRQFNRMSRSINDMVTQIREMEQEKAMLEKEALQAQLNPHFLFNTLSNMRFMAKLGQTEPLEECFGALGRMLQPLYRSEGELWTLREELDYMLNYLIIMNVRFGGQLDVEFEIGENLLGFQVLKFILQPLVENAIEHGFAGASGEGMIVLGAEQKNGSLKLYVEDNGGGISDERQSLLREQLEKAESQKELYRNHVGVVNVHRRLRVHFGSGYGLDFESVPGENTCIWLTMPLIEKEKPEP